MNINDEHANYHNVFSVIIIESMLGIRMPWSCRVQQTLQYPAGIRWAKLRKPRRHPPLPQHQFPKKQCEPFEKTEVTRRVTFLHIHIEANAVNNRPLPAVENEHKPWLRFCTCLVFCVRRDLYGDQPCRYSGFLQLNCANVDSNIRVISKTIKREYPNHKNTITEEYHQLLKVPEHYRKYSPNNIQRYSWYSYSCMLYKIGNVFLIIVCSLCVV